jgi:hypothetical protein
MFPDDSLLETFDYYVNSTQHDFFQGTEVWHTLVHVCRRWHDVIFGSPLRLNLCLYCRQEASEEEAEDLARVAHRYTAILSPNT